MKVVTIFVWLINFLNNNPTIWKISNVYMFILLLGPWGFEPKFLPAKSCMLTNELLSCFQKPLFVIADMDSTKTKESCLKEQCSAGSTPTAKLLDSTYQNSLIVNMTNLTSREYPNITISQYLHIKKYH